MIRGCDIDGVLTSVPFKCKLNLPWWLFICLYFIKANKDMVQMLRKWKDSQDKIILISARPERLRRLTESWLKKHNIPYDQLFLIGLEKGVKHRKLKVIKEQKTKMFIEDNQEIIEHLVVNEVNVLDFSSFSY